MGQPRSDGWYESARSMSSTFSSSSIRALETARDVVLVTSFGFQDDGRALDAFATWFEVLVAPCRRLDLFWDTSKVTGYEASCHARSARWYQDTRPFLQSSTVLVPSRMIALALAASNFFVRDCQDVTSVRHEFEAALWRRISERTSSR
jgi:hypothetical protein